ncbi:SUMF1/EgtB/PvdO family nonheme iron enzyme [Candidatus Poribacteria bacterium]|nr:SUMF1/EgtB/PvdO family nonheme iron enzyme [Candidatus Poribacteria bacterium]
MLLNPSKPKASRISLLEDGSPEAFKKLLNNYWTWYYQDSFFDEVKLLLNTDLEWENSPTILTPPVGDVVSPIGHALAHPEEEIRNAALQILNARLQIPKGTAIIGEECIPIEVNEFEIGVYPITNAQYFQFIKETKHNPPEHWLINVQNDDQDLDFSCYKLMGDHPVIWISCEDAEAYAKYANCRLPTFQEWQYCARGYDDRLFPWGNEIDKPRCNTAELGAESTTPVGLFNDGVSPFQCYDMIGNAWEWTGTDYDEEGRFRVACGGSWYYNHDYSTCISYDFFSKDYSEFVLGFRIAA